MAADSLFWDTNMAAVTSHKNTLYLPYLFSVFLMDQFGKIRRHHRKERLKISKIAKFESDTSLSSEGIAYKRLELRRRRSCILITFQQITFKLGNYTNFKALFSVESTHFSELVHVKS